MDKKSSPTPAEKHTGMDFALRIHDRILQTGEGDDIRVEIPLQRNEETPLIQAVVFQAETIYPVLDPRSHITRETGRLLIVGIVERSDGSAFIGALQFEASNTPLQDSLSVREITPPSAA